MSMNNDRLEDQTAGGSPQTEGQPMPDPSEPLATHEEPAQHARSTAEHLPSVHENDGQEAAADTARAGSSAPQPDLPATPAPVEAPISSIDAAPPADRVPEPSASQTDAAPDTDELPQDDAAIDLPYDGSAMQEEELPPSVSEPPLSTTEAPSETDGMSLLERAQYHARMRRREQTRLRRENARRAAQGKQALYQPMPAADMRFTLIRSAVAVVSLVVGAVMGRADADGLSLALYLLAYLVAGLPVAARVAQNVAHGKYFDEYLLVLIASFGAFLLGNRPEASVALILHDIGRMVSDLALRSTHGSLAQQTDFVPERASVVNMQGEERHVPPSEVPVGAFLLVRNGERVPLDSVVLRGEGTIDSAALTGDTEPIPVTKNARVLAGSLYTGSLLLLRTSARLEDCAVSQVMHVQEEGRDCRASIEDSVIHSAARVIPLAAVLAVLLAVIPPLFNSSTTMANWVYRALTILVICSPMALTISVPLSFLCGAGRLSQRGIHAKGSAAVEKMAELRMVVFNKTGILTKGDLRVKEIMTTQDFNQESILALAAAAEQRSTHPVARALVAAYPSVPQKISEFEEFPGRGVRARIGNRNLLAGNRRLMVSRGVKGVPDIRGTVVYIAYEGDYAGAIVLEDTVRPEAAEAVKGLRAQGVLRSVILTGDTELPTQQTADAIGIDTVHHGLLPEEKASKMEFLMRTIPTDGTAAYVGDGMDDTAELEQADVGVAMGVTGSRRTADAANVLILTHDLTRLTEAVKLCRNTHSIALQNMVVVLLVKLLLALLTLLGVAFMWQAVAADVLLTVLTVFNAARVLGHK